MAAEHLLHVAVDVAQVVLLLAEEALRLAHDHHDQQRRDRHDRQGDEGHLPRDGEHHGQDAHHRHQRGDDLRQALVEGLVDGVHVVGEQGEHLAVGRAVEIAERHAVDLGHHILAQLVGDLDRDVGHQPALAVAEAGRQGVQPQRGEQDAADDAERHVARAGDLRQDAVEELGGGAAQDLGANDGEGGRADGQHPDDEDGQPIGRQIGHQLAQRAFEVACFLDGHAHHVPAGAGPAQGAAAAHWGARERCRLRFGNVAVGAVHASASCLSCERAISR
jgi:hypothetical protein